jgi:hypothetical protein
MTRSLPLPSNPHCLTHQRAHITSSLSPKSPSPSSSQPSSLHLTSSHSPSRPHLAMQPRRTKCEVTTQWTRSKRFSRWQRARRWTCFCWGVSRAALPPPACLARTRDYVGCRLHDMPCANLYPQLRRSTRINLLFFSHTYILVRPVTALHAHARMYRIITSCAHSLFPFHSHAHAHTSPPAAHTGDLFHDNKPSRKTLHRCMELL